MKWKIEKERGRWRSSRGWGERRRIEKAKPLTSKRTKTVLVLLRERNFMGFIYAMKFLFLFFKLWLFFHLKKKLWLFFHLKKKLWLFFSQTNVGFCFDFFFFFFLDYHIDIRWACKSWFFFFFLVLLICFYKHWELW